MKQVPAALGMHLRNEKRTGDRLRNDVYQLRSVDGAGAELSSSLIAAKEFFIGAAKLSVFKNLDRANGLLTSGAAKIHSDLKDAHARVAAAKTIFTRAEHDCAQSGADYCVAQPVQAYATLFRARLASVEAALAQARTPPLPPIYGPPAPPGWRPPAPRWVPLVLGAVGVVGVLAIIGTGWRAGSRKARGGK
jgi:hypothetical protein